MKALILAGGKGTRLRPITHTFAKQLVPIANKPILFYGLEAVAQAGITEVGMIVGDTREEIRAAVGDGARWGLRVTYIPQEAPLGLAHAVKIAKDFLSNDQFVVYLGDNLIKDGITPFIKGFIQRRPNAQILLAKVPHPERFGVAELVEGRVVHLDEKPLHPKSELALVGVYLFDSTVFEILGDLKPSWRGELEITDAIQGLIDRGYEVRHYVISGWWKDTGRLEDLLEANRLVLETLTTSNAGQVAPDVRLEGKVIIEPGAEVRSSVIRGPAIIGERTRVVNSFVGPYTSIYHDVTVENSELENSIILEYSRIRGIHRIEGSLIGQRVEIEKSSVKPSAYRLMIGDSGRVEIP